MFVYTLNWVSIGWGDGLLPVHRQAITQGVWKKFSASAQSLKPKMFFFHSFIHLKISA